MTHSDLMQGDPTYAALWREYESTGNVLDAVNDGSSELPHWIASHKYDQARAAFFGYRRTTYGR